MRTTLFEKNLTTVTVSTNLLVAARTYEFVRFGESEAGYKRCQLCHQRIKRWAVIRSVTTRVRLRIGLDCHDKLMRLKGEDAGKLRKIEALGRKRHASQCQRWLRENITDSMFAWLREDVRTGGTPLEIARAVRFIDQNGHPQTIEEGKVLVEYFLSRGYSREGTFDFAKVDFSKLFSGNVSRVTPH